MYRYVILQNIVAPYKTLLFNALGRSLKKQLLVVYLSDTAGNREWRVAKDEITFPFEVLAPGREEDAGAVATARAAYRTLERHDPEVVVVGGYNYLAYWTALLWAKRKKRKFLVIVESHYLDRPRRPTLEQLKKVFVSRSDAALVDGTRHRDYAARLGLRPERIFIKNGTGPVDLAVYQGAMDRFKPDRERHCRELGLGPRNFIYVGRFSAEKNLLFLLDAYRKFREDCNAQWGLLLVGNGPQRNEIEAYIRDHRLEDTHLPGFKQKEDVAFYYALSDVLVLPSVSEPWGLVVAEAMACGLAVLVSNRCGCYPDIVRDGVNGFSFDPGRGDELLARMRDFSFGRADLEAMGKASLAMIQEYTPERVAEKYLDALRSVAGGAP